MARPINTTRVKKPIFKKEFDRLISATHKSLSIRSSTRVKLTRAFTLLYLTGCRVSEIIDFTTADLEKMIQDNEFSLTNDTKTRTPRLISFDTDHRQVERIQQILPAEQGYLFCRNNSTQHMSVDALKRLMNTMMHRTLGQLYSTHSFRAGYITTAHQLGLSLEHIRQDIGHKDLATTARYATVTNEEIAQAKNQREL